MTKVDKGFKKYYESKYWAWPGQEGEQYNIIFKNLCDTFAEYVDHVVETELKHPKYYVEPKYGPIDVKPNYRPVDRTLNEIARQKKNISRDGSAPIDDDLKKCKSDNPNRMCEKCNCWKHTRMMCS